MEAKQIFQSQDKDWKNNIFFEINNLNFENQDTVPTDKENSLFESNHSLKMLKNGLVTTLLPAHPRQASGKYDYVFTNLDTPTSYIKNEINDVNHNHTDEGRLFINTGIFLKGSVKGHQKITGYDSYDSVINGLIVNENQEESLTNKSDLLSDPSLWYKNGDYTFTANNCNINSHGSLWLNDKINITKNFVFSIENIAINGPNPNGFTITIQNDSLNALGANNEGLGAYEVGVNQGINKSVSIEVDLFQNLFESSTHIGINVNGDKSSLSTQSLGINSFSGGIELRYDGIYLKVYSIINSDKIKIAEFEINLKNYTLSEYAWIGITSSQSITLSGNVELQKLNDNSASLIYDSNVFSIENEYNQYNQVIEAYQKRLIRIEDTYLPVLSMSTNKTGILEYNNLFETGSNYNCDIKILSQFGKLKKIRFTDTVFINFVFDYKVKECIFDTTNDSLVINNSVNLFIDQSKFNEKLVLTNCDNVIIENSDFKTIEIYNSKNITISNNTFKQADTCIYINEGSKNIIVDSCFFTESDTAIIDNGKFNLYLSNRYKNINQRYITLFPLAIERSDEGALISLTGNNFLSNTLSIANDINTIENNHNILTFELENSNLEMKLNSGFKSKEFINLNEGITSLDVSDKDFKGEVIIQLNNKIIQPDDYSINNGIINLTNTTVQGDYIRVIGL